MEFDVVWIPPTERQSQQIIGTIEIAKSRLDTCRLELGMAQRVGSLVVREPPAQCVSPSTITKARSDDPKKPGVVEPARIASRERLA